MLSIVTARNKSELDDDAGFQRVLKYFDFIVCADDTKKYKPDPEPLLYLLKKADAKYNETIYIGDAYTDFLCARNTGVDFGLALWGALNRNGIDAEYYFERPEDIIDILD
jgi:phosphoglycolate phosphatase-like HAD superfamily hydrolase